MILFVGVLSIVFAWVALASALGVIGGTEKAVLERLTVGRQVNLASQSEAPELLVRERRTGLVGLITAATAVSKIERNIMLAGRPKDLTLRRIVILKPILLGLGLLIFYVLVSHNPSRMNWLVGIALAVASYFAPDVIVSRRAQERQLQIQQELPDVLDQVTISISAGLGFEAAFARIGERRTGPLADEIVRTVQDMRLGMTRRDAYQALADRTDVDDLRSFVKAITQAEKYGVSIAAVMRNQSVEMRFKRKARAEGEALKVPVKIIFPLITCIFPVLFIVVLAPAFINLAKNLSGGL